MCNYTIQNLREIGGLVLRPFLANQRLDVNTNWVSETHPHTDRLFYRLSEARQLSPEAWANVDFLHNNDAVFGETIKEAPYILPRGAAVTVPQIRRSLVRFQTVSLEFFNDIILPIALRSLGRLNL